MIAFLDEPHLRRIVKAKGLPRFTKNTITSWTALTANLRLSNT